MKNNIFSPALSLLLFVLSLCISTQPAIAQSSGPCIRTVASDVSLHQISGAFNGVFTEAGSALQGEPLHVELLMLDYETPDVEAFHAAMGAKVDYLFRGKITADKKKSNFTAMVKLIDVPRNIVVKSQTTSWSTSHNLSTEIKAGKQLAQGFMPLKELLYEYEKIPLKGEINVPGDEVGTGDKVMINVEKLRFKEELPKSWQYLAVKVEKGKILNGTLLDGYYYFQIGKSDFIEVAYQAPEGCKDQTECMEVYNTCIFYWEGDNRSFSSLQKDKILSKEFPIVCYDGELITEVEVNVPGQIGKGITQLQFKRIKGGNKVKGIGYSTGGYGFVSPGAQGKIKSHNLVEFQGTINEDGNGKKFLDFDHKLIGVVMQDTFNTPGGVIFHKLKIMYDTDISEHTFRINGGGGMWGVIELSVYKNDVLNKVVRYCNESGCCCVGSIDNLGNLIMVRMCKCAECDPEDPHGCIDVPVVPYMKPAEMPGIAHGRIEWKNGAEIPVNFGAITGKTKLVLYKK